MPSSRRPPRPGASARPARGGSGPSRGATAKPSSAKPSAAKPSPAKSSPARSSDKPSTARQTTPGAPAKKSAPSAKKPASTPKKPASTPKAASSAGSSTAGARRPSTRARTTPRPSRRPAGPAREDRRRSRYGFLLPEVVTVRALVLSVVGLLALVLLLPTVRAYVNQTGELRELRNDLAQAQSEHDELQAELDRWDDRAFVEREARDRLNFVMPGEQPWRVLDPETVVDDIDPLTGREITDGPVQGYEAGTPWYEAIWTSVQVAGEQPVPGDEAADGSDGDGAAGDEPASGTGENG